MKSIPLPVRVAAGLAATALEQARTLPTKLAGLPVTVVSQALQVSMRVQQQVTELAIRGDEVLAGLRPVEETPEWATFDEDLDDDTAAAPRPSAFDRVSTETAETAEDDDVTELADVTDLTRRTNGFVGADPWVQEERALVEEAGARELDLVTAENYDHLSLPQLRARLRRFSVEELTELLEYERAHGNRPSFVGMLTRRIATVRDSGE
ncbi:lipid droplet-associated protein [Actinophytocola xanthii]|uniref:DUF8129 domain-containing protein n=1 Tax=Actinophytocola xanthii TaxID=1912961 RepID=A0A1Q8CMK8_9PSEU|nr:lipid droplet-associated protein [Actinophytocola xanthii]OLF15587.1 hypothetical protein BU204_20945 [Actinophytocola xanthii]